MNCRIDGPEAGAGTLVLSHSLATSLRMWEPQVSCFSRRYRVLRYDIRGHGGSEVPEGPYTVRMLADDVHALLRELNIDKVHFVGLSMGGMIAQLFAATYPHMVSGLVLCGTTSRVAPEAGPMWDERIELARKEGMEPHVESTVARWFTPPFIPAHPDTVDRVREMIRATNPSGYAACGEAVKTFDAGDRLASISAPTLIVVGQEDPGVPVEAARALQERIQGARLVMLPNASHLSNIEQPDAFNRTVMDFLEGVDGD